MTEAARRWSPAAALAHTRMKIQSQATIAILTAEALPVDAAQMHVKAAIAVALANGMTKAQVRGWLEETLAPASGAVAGTSA